MKRISCFLALLLALIFFTTSAVAEARIQRIGALALLNLSESEYSAIQQLRMEAARLLKEEGADDGIDSMFSEAPEIVYFDSLQELLMALDSDIIQAADLPKDVAAYVASRNDGMKILRDFSDMPVEGEKAMLVSFVFETLLSCDYSFMAKAENEALLTEMESAVNDMREDGTMDALVEAYIDGAMQGDPEVKAIEPLEGRETVRVIVTGDMPPIDFMTAGGEPTGFNVALLAEIGRRIDRNIELVAANAGARALMLASGEADVAFWTRSSDGIRYMMESGVREEDWEELFEIEDEADAHWVDVINEKLVSSFDAAQYGNMDTPEGLVVSDPYYTSTSVLLVKKSLTE